MKRSGISTHRTALRRGLLIALLLASALGVPPSTMALPTDSSEIEAGGLRRGETPSASSLWDQPATSAPVVVRPPQATPAKAERTPSANPLWAIPLATLSNTRERPIFSPSRRPPPPAVAAAPVEKPPPPKPLRVERPQLSLVGTVGGGDESIGIFVDLATKAALRLKIGEAYQGWKLRAVQGREVTLERDQLTAILSLPQPGGTTLSPLRAKPESTAMKRPVEIPQRDGRR